MAVRIPQLKSCCCGCPLRTGSKIIGWLELVCSILSVAIFWLGLVGLSFAEGHSDMIDSNRIRESTTTEDYLYLGKKVYIYNSHGQGKKEIAHIIPPGMSREEFLAILPVMKALLVSLIATSLASGGFAFVLLLGVYQEHPKLVLFWVIASLIITVIAESINIAQVIAFEGQGFLIIRFLISLYFILVVYSYYREMKSARNYACSHGTLVCSLNRSVPPL